MQIIIMWSADAAALTMEAFAVDGEHDAIMAYGEKVCREHEAEGQDNMAFVLTTLGVPAVQCFMPEQKRGAENG